MTETQQGSCGEGTEFLCYNKFRALIEITSHRPRK